jgi:hypothetical protein
LNHNGFFIYFYPKYNEILSFKTVMMKKIIFCLSFALPLLLNAQKIKMGILASPQITWIKPAGNEDIVNEGTKLGIDIGLSVEKYFTDNYAFLTGISLCNMGGSISFTDSVTMNVNNEDLAFGGQQEMDISLQYIKVPLALKFTTKEIGYLTYFAQIGMEAGVNVKAVMTTNVNDINGESIADEFNLFNTGYLIGGGAEYSLGGSSTILFGIQYQSGIVDVLNTTPNKVVTSKFTLLLGIMF